MKLTLEKANELMDSGGNLDLIDARYTVAEIIDMTGGQYGAERFREFFALAC